MRWLSLVLLLAIAPCAAEASTYRWQVDADGNWNDPANWELVQGPAGAGYPNLPGDVAVYDTTPSGFRTITIPDTVTVSIGRLSVTLPTSSLGVRIARAGSGFLVFDNAGEDAVIESVGSGLTLQTAVQLAADVVINGQFAFSGGIGEAGGARNVTITGGLVSYSAPNTYTGVTTVTNGHLLADQGPVAVRMFGTLVVGDGVGAAASASVEMRGDSIDDTADVLVRADGAADFERGSGVDYLHRIRDLTVEGGSVRVSLTSTRLIVQQTLTMVGGDITMGGSGGGTALYALGAVNATSTAAGPAIIRGQGPVSGALVLGPGLHDFTIADGPQPVDFETIAADIGQYDPDVAAVTKKGAGVMRIGRNAFYTGVTSIEAGEVIVIGNASATAIPIAGSATLSGTGTVGPLLTQTNGRVIPGANPGTGILQSGPANLSNGTLFIEMKGTTAGIDHDQLKVVGGVTLTGATLNLAVTGFQFPPLATFTIVDNDGSDAVNGTFAGLPEGATIDAPSGASFTISYQGGDGNDVTLTNATPVTYFLSEGATGTFFDEDVLIANPNDVPAPVTLTFFLPGGGTVVRQAAVPAKARRTVHVDDFEGLENTTPSVEVRSDNRLTLAVERTMFWDSSHYGGHTANSVPRPEKQWLFAEGAQNGFFDTYLLLANPAASEVMAKVTFLRETEAPFILDVSLPASSRTTIYAGDHSELTGRSFGIVVDTPSAITAERAMYFATTPQRLWSGGHDNVGSPEASTSWFHPEGATGSFFNTFILMSNPQDTPATVTMKFLLEGGQPPEITKTIPAKSRLTVNPAAEGLAVLENASFSTVVTSDVPIVSERAMYWNADDTVFGEGHASSGLTTTALTWTLAEGRVGGPDAYTTYILLANPNDVSVNVNVTFLRETGAAVVLPVQLSANTRFNIDVGGMVPEIQNESFGVLVESLSVPIAVERSMYWNSGGRFWSGGTNAVGTIVPQ